MWPWGLPFGLYMAFIALNSLGHAVASWIPWAAVALSAEHRHGAYCPGPGLGRIYGAAYAALPVAARGHHECGRRHLVYLPGYAWPGRGPRSGRPATTEA